MLLIVGSAVFYFMSTSDTIVTTCPDYKSTKQSREGMVPPLPFQHFTYSFVTAANNLLLLNIHVVILGAFSRAYLVIFYFELLVFNALS